MVVSHIQFIPVLKWLLLYCSTVRGRQEGNGELQARLADKEKEVSSLKLRLDSAQKEVKNLYLLTCGFESFLARDYA